MKDNFGSLGFLDQRNKNRTHLDWFKQKGIHYEKHTEFWGVLKSDLRTIWSQ